MKNIYSSLDIGSNTVKLVVGEIIKDKLNILTINEVKSKGVKKGLIVNPEEFLLCLKELFSQTEDMLGIKITKVITTVPSYYSEFLIGEGYSTITRDEKKVNGNDIVRALQASVYNRIADNRELVTVTPIEFTLDENEKVDDPKGEECEKLTVTSVLATVPKKNIYSVVSILDSLGIDVVDICLNASSDYEELKVEGLDKKTGAIINIGKDKTEVSIINKGIVIATENISIGGKNIDRDISYIYKINEKQAKRLKEQFALATKRNASMREYEILEDEEGNEVKINQYELSEIVNSRLIEILELSKKQINLLTKKEIHYIIINGGTSEIKDFVEVASNMFGKTYINTSVNEIGARNNKYTSVLGSIKLYYNKLIFRGKSNSTMTKEEQELLFSIKKDKNASSKTMLGKVYGYFFDN